MIRKILISMLFLLSFTMMGCKKHTIIPDEVLSDIFHDAFLVNSYYKGNSAQKDSLLLYEPIFARYGYTTEDVQYTIGNFSKRKSARLGDVVELAIQRLEKEGEVLNKAVADLDTVNNIACRLSERVIYEDSLIRVQRLRDTTQLLIQLDSVRTGEYRIRATYEIDSMDENRGLRFQCWMETADSAIRGLQQVQMRRERVEEIERTLRCDTSIRRIAFNFWIPRSGSERKSPSITLRDVKIYYQLGVEEALDSLYEKELQIRIFADDFLRTIQADSLTLPADSTRLAEKSAR